MSTTTPQKFIVTGATGGMGKQICLTLAEKAKQAHEKISISALASKPGSALDSLIEELQKLGVDSHGIAADLTQENECIHAIETSIHKMNGVTSVISNAGLSRAASISNMTSSDWDLMFNLNAKATWLISKTAYPALKESKGNIVAIASMSGIYPHPGLGAYSASKAALLMLCRQLAQEWSSDRIRVNTISPGMIRTPLTESLYQDESILEKRLNIIPMGRIGTVFDIAEAVFYLTSPAASYITGENIKVDGGFTDRLLGTIPGRTAAK
jgi:glucose 1-dehydrogenase